MHIKFNAPHGSDDAELLDELDDVGRTQLQWPSLHWGTVPMMQSMVSGPQGRADVELAALLGRHVQLPFTH